MRASNSPTSVIVAALICGVIVSSTSEPATADTFCARLYRYHVVSLDLHLKARTLPPSKSQALVLRGGAASSKGWTDPETGRPVTDRGYQSCDQQTQDVVDASNLLADWYYSLSDDVNLTSELAVLVASNGPPNHYISPALYRNLLAQTVAAMQKRHDGFDAQFIVAEGETRSEALATWRAVFIAWLGAVPPNFPDH